MAILNETQGKAECLLQRFVFELDGAHLAYVVGINAQRDIAMARRLIERRIPVDASELADPAKPLAQMLKAKA